MDSKNLTAEAVLNYGDNEKLREEFALSLVSDSEDSLSAYADNNPFSLLTQENSNSETSDSDNETNSLNLPDNNLKSSESDNASFKSANSEEEFPYKGTYHYEFLTDDQALILS
jgi:hypothetical protein